MATARMGMNAMEIDTAIRHKIPILIVISLNGGWTGDPKREKPGRDLGYVRLRQDVRGAGRLRRIHHASRRISVRRWNVAQTKVDEGMVALVNVRTDYRARFAGAAFSDYST